MLLVMCVPSGKYAGVARVLVGRFRSAYHSDRLVYNISIQHCRKKGGGEEAEISIITDVVTALLKQT